MEKEMVNFYENNLFRYDNHACICRMNLHYIDALNPPLHEMICQSIEDKPIRFAFAPKEGLIRLQKNGAVDEANILASLISLPDNDSDAFALFFQKNGFLFNVSSDHYEVIDLDSVNRIIKRIKSTVSLLSYLGDTRKNYTDILHHVLFLLFSEPIKLLVGGKLLYESYVDPFKSKLENASYPQPTIRRQEAVDNDYYEITDKVYSSYSFSVDRYSKIENGDLNVPGSNDWIYKRVVNMYCYGINEDDETRDIVDFLFHYEQDVGIIKSESLTSTLQWYSSPNNEMFSDALKKQLMKVVKIVLNHEINANIAGIHPKYDVQSMSPSWQVESLLSAIYFSVFYMRPELELYRKCANPNCGKYFLVKSTSTRNKYCSSECCNRMSQSFYRKRKKEQLLREKTAE